MTSRPQNSEPTLDIGVHLRRDRSDGMPLLSRVRGVSSSFGGESGRLPGRRAGSGPRRPPPGPGCRTDVLGRPGSGAARRRCIRRLRLAQGRGREGQRLRPGDPGVYGAPAHRPALRASASAQVPRRLVAPKPDQVQAKHGCWSSISPPNRPERPIRRFSVVSSHLRAIWGHSEHGSSHHRSTHRIRGWFVQQPCVTNAEEDVM